MLTRVSVVRHSHAGSVLQRNQTLTSEERTMTTIIDGVDAFADFVGKDLGHSEWQPITQDRVNLFADAHGLDLNPWLKVYGEGSSVKAVNMAMQSLVLIPGLGSDGAVWRRTIAAPAASLTRLQKASLSPASPWAEWWRWS